MPWAIDPATFPFEDFSTVKLQELAQRSQARLSDPNLTISENAAQLRWHEAISSALAKREVTPPKTFSTGAVTDLSIQ